VDNLIPLGQYEAPVT